MGISSGIADRTYRIKHLLPSVYISQNGEAAGASWAKHRPPPADRHRPRKCDRPNKKATRRESSPPGRQQPIAERALKPLSASRWPHDAKLMAIDRVMGMGDRSPAGEGESPAPICQGKGKAERDSIHYQMVN